MDVASLRDSFVQGIRQVGVFLGNCFSVLSWPLLFVSRVFLADEWPPALLFRFLPPRETEITGAGPSDLIPASSKNRNRDLNLELQELKWNLKDKRETLRMKERKIEELKKSINALRQDGERVKTDLMKKIKEKDGAVIRLQKTTEEYRALCQSKEGTIGELKRTVQHLEQEKESALNRLSAIMCAQLRNDNPDIADLSDQYRPTKLSEMCSELYDNQWTMAFEVLSESLDERVVINRLLAVVMETQNFCTQMVDKQWQVLTTWFLSDTAIPGALETKQWLEESRKKHALKLLPSIQQDARRHIQSLFNLPISASFHKYVDGCVELCLMCSVQVPRVVLVEYTGAGTHQVTGSQPRESSKRRSSRNKTETQGGQIASSFGDCGIYEKRMKLDRNIYKEYTCCGDFIDYVVWPAMFIEKNWQMLSKGVAQGCK